MNPQLPVAVEEEDEEGVLAVAVVLFWLKLSMLLLIKNEEDAIKRKFSLFVSFSSRKNKTASGNYRRTELCYNLESSLVLAEVRKK